MTAFERQLATRDACASPARRPAVDALALRPSPPPTPDSQKKGASRCSPHSSSSPPASSWRCSAASCSPVSSPRRRMRVPPAAVTDSPSPMTTEELLSGMVTEEVEPGVYGSSTTACGTSRIRRWLGLSGQWTSPRTAASGCRASATGTACSASARSRCSRTGWPPSYREVAPDGSLWAIGEVPDGREGIFSFDGEGWTVRATTTDHLSRWPSDPTGRSG